VEPTANEQNTKDTQRMRTVSVKYSMHGVYIEYDTLNFSMHNSTSRPTQNVLKVSSLKKVSN